MTTTMPTLTGSEKQIEWASEIRERAIPVMREHGAELVANAARVSKPAGAAAQVAVSAWIARLEAETDAAWWISNKDLANLHGGWQGSAAYRAFFEAAKQAVRAAR